MALHMVDLTVKALQEVELNINDAKVAVLGYAYLENSDTALSQYGDQYQELRQASSCLRDISNILEHSDDQPVTGDHIACHLRTYLDDLLAQPGLSVQLDTFRLHIDKVSRIYWSGLLHCYDLEAFPRTNSALESHFRDIGRRLLRTNGQQGLTS